VTKDKIYGIKLTVKKNTL